MLKRILFPFTLLFCLIITMNSCRDDEDDIIDLPEELVSGPIRISVPENPWHIKRTADYYALYVECQGSGWMATCESEWLTISPAEGTESQYIRFDVEENPEPFARIAVITIADAKEPDLYRVQVRIRQSGYNDEDNATLTGDMLKKHRMGYGYNIMKEYASDASYSNDPVLDYEKIVNLEESKNITIISEDRRHYQDLEIFSGNTTTELSGQLTKSMDEKATFLGCGKITNTETDIYRSKSIDQVCGYVRLKQIVSSRTIDVGALRSQATSDDSPLFSKKFREALNKIKNKSDAAALFFKFGTHLVVSADLGGSLELHTLITRETSIETQHSVTTVTKKVFGKTKGQSSKTYDDYQKEIGIDYKADLSCIGGNKNTYGVMQAAVKQKRQITPGEINAWQASFNIDPADAKEYNVGMIGCRLIPIYEIINDPSKREWIQAAFAEYTNSPNMAPVQEEKPARIETSIVRDKWNRDNNSCAIRAYTSDSQNRAIFAKEYVPAIRRDAAVIVAYPIVKGKPYFYSGVFIGDAEHRPGIVRWLGNNCLYEANDSISYDSSKFAQWFDNSKALKQLYFYDAAVQILPPTSNNKYVADKDINNKINIATVSINTKGFLNIESMPLVKVGPWLWTESSRGKIDTIAFSPSSLKLNKDNDFTFTYYPTKNIFVLRQWEKHNKRFANYSQTESLMKVCNGNLNVLFDTDGNGRNLLGLKWAKGYLGKKFIGKATHYDTNAYIIVTYNGKREITRLTPSGRPSHLSDKEYLDGMFNSWNNYCYLPIFLATKEIQ